jgi:hypothetical protein
MFTLGARTAWSEEKEALPPDTSGPPPGMPAHPDLQKEFKEGKKPVPDFIKDPEILREKGIDQGGQAPGLEQPKEAQPAFPDSQQEQKPKDEVIPGEFIIKFKEQTPIGAAETKDGVALTGIASIDQLNKKFKARAVERIYADSPKFKEGTEQDIFGLTRTYRFVFPPDANLDAILAGYRADANVESADPKYLVPVESGVEFFPAQFLVQFKINAPKPLIEVKEGIAVTGIPSVDALNKKFQVTSIEKMIPENSQADNEAETIDLFGLLRFYKFKVPEGADIATLVKEYQLDPMIETASPSYKAGK